MDSSTDVKIASLKEVFPEIKDDQMLLEILISCDGSLKRANELLLEQFDDGKGKKRKIDEIGGSVYQSSIKKYLQTSGSDKRALPVGKLNKSNTKTLVLYTKEDVESALPTVTLYKNFLPQEIASNILRHLMENRKMMKKKEFYIHGKPCNSNHKTGVFSSNDSFLHNKEELVYNGIRVQELNRYNDDFRIMQMLVEDQVNSAMQSRARKSPFQATEWHGDFAICNMFETKDNNLDWHSDRLAYIGPLPTIASLSLGATREFKLRKNHPVKANHNPIISIPLPHNTLVVMHAGTQEEYKHCVMASSTAIDKHPLSNQMRFNLTLRNYIPRYYREPPLCKCGIGMILRRSFKDVQSRGKYFWQCNNVYQNKDCGQFHWAKFDTDSLTCDEEKSCSVWIADDDHEKYEYMKENGITFNKDKGVFEYH